ncbi:MAG: hypothetical protein PHY40_00035 [Patescibacteria group bacterium]|nr:hypothetical protein [Patescibacteria group bacterium]
MLKIALEKKIIIIVAALAVLMAAIIFGVILPTVRNIQLLNKETYEIRTYLEKRSQSVKQVYNSIKQIEKIKNEIQEYEKRIFGVGGELKLITALEQIATKNKINQKIERSNLDEQKNKQITMSLDIKGTYLNVLNYLADLENLDYFLNVEEIFLTPDYKAGAEENFEQADMRLNIKLYVN